MKSDIRYSESMQFLRLSDLHRYVIGYIITLPHILVSW